MINFGFDEILKINNIFAYTCIKSIRLKFSPVNGIAIAIIHTGAIGARTDFPHPRTGQAKIMGNIIEVLSIDGIARCRINPIKRKSVIKITEYASTMSPTFDRLKASGSVERNRHLRRGGSEK